MRATIPLPGVRPAERGRALFFAVLGAVFTLAQTVGLAGAEAVFLARLGVERLPATFLLAAAVTIVATGLYAMRVGRARNDRVFAEVLVLGAAAVLVAAIGAAQGSPLAPPALLCLFFAGQAVLQNHYWTFVGDFFDTLSQKRVVPVFTVGMSLGGMAGGALALGLGRVARAEALLVAWAVGLAVGAAGLLASQRAMRRWRAMAFDEEEDETSVAGLRAAARYVRRSELGRWLVVSALAMVTALFVAQFLYSDVLVRAFPDERRLAVFLGVFLAVTNAVEVVVELWITPWLIARLGVARANLVHPILTVASFAWLAASYRLPAALAARMNREMLENAMAGPMRNLVYNALPLRFRPRVRAFLEGIVVYAGMFVAGAMLLWVDDLAPRFLCGVGAGLGGLYLLANLRVRDAYRRALVEELRARRLDLRDLGGELGRRELSELAALWSQLLSGEGERPAAALLDLAPVLAARGIVDPLRVGLGHPSAAVREACLDALRSTPANADAAPWLAALEDPDPRVRLAGVRGVAPDLAAAPGAAVRLRAALADPAPDVRAEAAARLDDEDAQALLEKMAVDPDPQVAVAALARLPAASARIAASRLDDPDARVRAAAARGLGRSPEAALEARDALARALADPERRVRRATARTLAELGAPGRAAAAVSLGGESEFEVDGALRVLGASPSRRGRELLLDAFRARVHGAWEALLALRAIPGDASPAVRFLRLALTDVLVRDTRLAFRILARLEDPSVVRSVDRALRFAPDVRARADALEILSTLGDPEAGARLALLLEQAPLEDRLPAALAFVPAPADFPDVLEQAQRSSSRHVRLAATLLEEGASAGDPRWDAMSRLLFLRQVPLFAHLGFEQLEAVERLTREVDYVRGEVIVREDTPGNELFLIEEGEVNVYRGYGRRQQVLLNRMGPGSAFGEMAVLASAPRTATIVAATDCRLLSLGGDRLRELVLEMPDLALEIIRELSERVRAAEGRLLQEPSSEAGEDA